MNFISSFFSSSRRSRLGLGPALLWLPLLLVPPASAQSLVLIATVTIASPETGTIAAVNACSYPVDLLVEIAPYWQDGDAELSPLPPKPLSLAAGEIKTMPLELIPSVDGIAYADVKITPGPRQGPAGSCFAPGQRLVHAAVAVFSDDRLSSLIQGGTEPQNNPSAGRGDFGPFIQVGVPALVPLRKGDNLQFRAANACPNQMDVNAEVLISDGATLWKADTSAAYRERLVYTFPSPVESDIGWVVIVANPHGSDATCAGVIRVYHPGWVDWNVNGAAGAVAP